MITPATQQAILAAQGSLFSLASSNVAGATLPCFQASNAKEIFTLPVAAAPSTRTVS